MRVQIIRVKDYGDDWVNRLALVLKAFEQMEPREREASLEFVVSKYVENPGTRRKAE